MSLRYRKVRKQSKLFRNLFGVTPATFETIVNQVEPLWQESLQRHYRRPGRCYKLDLSNMVLMLLLYYRSYTTQRFIGLVFGIDDSRVCRIMQKLEPIVARVVAIDKRRIMGQGTVEALIIDATEQAIERPKRGQRPYYSGKKKRHTHKTELRVTREGAIVHVSRTRPGSVHDFTLFKDGVTPPPEVHLFTDSGYQGIDKLHRNCDFPFKAPKKRPLDIEEKTYNTALARVRIKVEHILAKIKAFKILAHRYRNKRKRYGVKFNIIAGIVNINTGFKQFKAHH